MKSAYPSSQSFFDASSDSIRAIDVEKCRTSSSFSSLSDLFARNPNGKSGLFSNVRTPVFVPTEVTFPSRKNRECEDRATTEKVSIWHEWGSGECPGEESSGLLADKSMSSGSELYSPTSSNLFPNLGSANATVVPEEFTFPERRKREDESWRERRGIRQDWIPSLPTAGNNVRESTAMISSVADFFAKNNAKASNLLSSSKPSLFSNLGAPMGSQPEFPARRKRDENPFWKDYSGGVDSTPSECTTSGSSTCGVNSLSGLYSKSPSTSNCSSLFSNLGTALVNSEEVVFPSRKKNPDRNAWRDWRNTGYSDWAQDDSDDEISQTKAGPQKEASAEKARSLARPSLSAVSRRNNSDSEAGIVAKESSTPNLARSGLDALHPIGAEVLRSSRFSPADSRLSGKMDCECQAVESAALIGEGDVCIAERTNPSSDRLGFSESAEKVPREKYVTEELDDDEDDVHLEERYRSCRRDLHEQRISRQKVHSFPPPLGFLGRQGSLRVPHHLPWVQLQPVRTEGRFMLQEVKVTQPVVFEPIREQGRLVLQLIRQDDKSDSTEREAQGSEIVRDDSNTWVKDETAAADEGLKVEAKREKDEEPEAVIKELLVKNCPSRKVNKCPKIYPEGCLPTTHSEVSVVAPELAMDEGLEAISAEQKSVDSQESSQAWRTKRALNDLKCGRLEFPRASLIDPGRQDRFLIQSLSAFACEKGVDAGLNEEKPSLFRREAEAPSQRAPLWNSPSKLREFDNLAPYKSAFRSCNPRTAATLECGSPFAPPLHRSRSIRNTNLSDYGRVEGEKEEATKDLWRGRDDEGCDPRPPFGSSGQGYDGALGLQTTSHFLQWSLKKRHETPGDPDARLANYGQVAASFSCADNLGKRHHEKSFWEQPCVS
ncbi:hypothetical protein Mapa_011407 [Marchantia paleacea]|nr:hypothetical protein Mapa_011407 [Marchantia paleacea]